MAHYPKTSIFIQKKEKSILTSTSARTKRRAFPNGFSGPQGQGVFAVADYH
jgi:hypothetical protein